MTQKKCPCSDKPFNECCERFLLKEEIPKTCEELMRSRYSAFALKDVSYIEKTMTGPAKEGFNNQALENDLKHQQFLSLRVLDSSEKGDRGIVEFQAIFTIDGKEYCLHEKSQFIKQEGKWMYYDGKIY